MSNSLFDETNPFEAPKARIGELANQVDEVDLGDAESIRAAHINHESSVRVLGILYYVGTFFVLLGTVSMFLIGSGVIPMNVKNNSNLPPEFYRYLFFGAGVFYLLVATLFGAVGVGLRKLQSWARWTALVLTCLGLVYLICVGLLVCLTNLSVGLIVISAGILIPGYLMYLMLSPKASMVFSAEYKLIILKTPGLRARTTGLTRAILVVLVSLLMFLMVAWAMSSDR